MIIPLRHTHLPTCRLGPFIFLLPFSLSACFSLSDFKIRAFIAPARSNVVASAYYPEKDQVDCVILALRLCQP